MYSLTFSICAIRGGGREGEVQYTVRHCWRVGGKRGGELGHRKCEQTRGHRRELLDFAWEMSFYNFVNKIPHKFEVHVFKIEDLGSVMRDLGIPQTIPNSSSRCWQFRDQDEYQITTD